jgi:tetratricopeptide (TPR) repeat protein
MERDCVHKPVSPVPTAAPPCAKGIRLFALSLAALVISSLFAGAMLRPLIDVWRQPSALASGEIAVFIEHAALDVRLGLAAPLTERLRVLATRVADPVTRERVLGLHTEAALQAGQLSDAASSEEQRETLVFDANARNAIRLRRIGLAAALGQLARAAELAAPLIAGGDTRLADEARVRLSSSMKREELRSWIESPGDRDPEETRRAGLAALRLLGDATQAERLLGPLERSGQRDASLCEALTEIYLDLDRPWDLARVLDALLADAKIESERARLVLLQASALARAGDSRSALALLEPLRRSQDPVVQLSARRGRFEILKKAGLLDAEVDSLREPGERAFVALTVQRDYEEAVRLYQSAIAAHPDSIELAQGLREAERRRELAERRALYEQVLAKDPEDQPTREKLLAVFVALGENEAVRQFIGQMLKGRETVPEALIGVALALKRAGLDRDAAGFLERAYAAETDAAKKQQIMFSLGDLYAEARREEDARRLYTTLATDGANSAVRERAVSRLASMLR